ncbi:MAG: hypothetical protein LH603_00080 [Pseudonocardia sp.]|nr:hypothetical protein [Pseudonocardia sp.]
MDTTTCPECGAVAEVQDRVVLTPAPDNPVTALTDGLQVARGFTDALVS